jgi:hypothetical protein
MLAAYVLVDVCLAEDRGSIFVRNVGELLHVSTAPSAFHIISSSNHCRLSENERLEVSQ